MTETPGETDFEALARTTLSDRDLLIHAIQHLEILTEQMAETRESVLRMDGELSAFAPLLEKLKGGGIGAVRAVWDARKGTR